MRITPPIKAAALLSLTALLLMLFPKPVDAQDAPPEPPPATVELLSPYLGVAVEPGETATFNIDLLAPDGETVDLRIESVPEGWDAKVRGGSFVVSRVLVDDELDPNLRLEVDVPQDAQEGAYEITLVADGARSSDRLDFQLVVAEAVGGGVSLSAEFPALRGPSDVDFTFNLELANDTGEELQFGLQAQGPVGWQVDARPSGQSNASTVTVAAGSTERVTVEVDPPDFTPAGVYPVVVQAAGGGETATAELSVEITGNFDMALLTPDDRLNIDVEAGKPSEMTLVVLNEGTAPLTDVSLTAIPPRGWEVTFSPETIDGIEPGGTAEVVATVTPSGDAITGDYRITMRATVAETADEIEVRATVKTSAIWGLVGVGVILVALASLVIVFARFGRR